MSQLHILVIATFTVTEFFAGASALNAVVQILRSLKRPYLRYTISQWDDWTIIDVLSIGQKAAENVILHIKSPKPIARYKIEPAAFSTESYNASDPNTLRLSPIPRLNPTQ